MIDNAYYLGTDWGKRMRDSPYGWYRENHINRLLEDDFIGSGNSFKLKAVTSDNLDWGDQIEALGSNPSYGLKKNFKFYGPIIPIGFMAENQLRFHQGYRRLNYCQQAILWVHFVPEVNHQRKLNLLKITNATYDEQFDLSLIAVTREIDRIDAEPSRNRESACNQTSQEVVGPLWSCRIFSYVHKVAINDKRRNPFPISLDENGHSNPHSPFVSGPIDPNVYCKRPNDELFAVVPHWEWMRLRRQGELDNRLTDLRGSLGQPTLITQGSKPIRILRQKRKGQWLIGKEDDLQHIRKLKGLEHIAIAGSSSDEDALKAIWGLDNDAYLPACSSQESFDQKAMRGFKTREGVKITGIQGSEVQLEIRQKLVEFEEKISAAEEQGLTDLCKQHKKDMADYKRLTTGSCIKKKLSRPADEGDIFRPILHDLRERRKSAMGVLRKNGLHDEADDLERCYKIENRTAIFFASRSRFTWVFDKEQA